MPFVDSVNKDVTNPMWLSHCPNRIIMSAELLPMVINCALIMLSRWHVYTQRFAHEVCLTSLSLHQTASQITMIRHMGALLRRLHFIFYYRMSDCSCGAANCNTSVCSTVCLKMLCQTVVDFQRRNLLNLSLGSTSLIHCDRKFLEKLYCTR